MPAILLFILLLAAEILAGRFLATKIQHLEHHRHDLLLVLDILEAILLMATAAVAVLFVLAQLGIRGRW